MRSNIPPVSPYGLIQETLWPDEFKILVSCMLLNCTTRRAAEKVIPKLFERYPDAKSMAAADREELSSLIAVLGFRNRRTDNLIAMSKEYLKGTWSHPRHLPGIGEYASAAWEIFVAGKLPKDPPRDHALVRYWKWRKRYGD